MAREKKALIFLILLLGILAPLLLKAQSPPPEDLQRTAVFVVDNNKVLLFRLKGSDVRVAPLVQAIGEYSRTSFVYNGMGYPVPQIVNVPEFQKVGQRLLINTPQGEKVFENTRWQIVPMLDPQGYPFVDLDTRLELAAQNFGLITWDAKNNVIHALTDQSVGIPESLGQVAEFNP